MMGPPSISRSDRATLFVDNAASDLLQPVRVSLGPHPIPSDNPSMEPGTAQLI